MRKESKSIGVGLLSFFFLKQVSLLFDISIITRYFDFVNRYLRKIEK
nr:MAG TPA: hypothetical protein [Caudoviricetes sp.]